MHEDDRLKRLAGAFESRLPPAETDGGDLSDAVARNAIDRLETLGRLLGERDADWSATDQVAARLLLADLDIAVQAIRRETSGAGARLAEVSRLLKQLDAELKRNGQSDD